MSHVLGVYGNEVRRLINAGQCRVCKATMLIPARFAAQAKYCSRKCAALAVSTKIPVNCAVCNKTFERQKKKVEKSKLQLFFCSWNCKNSTQRINGLIVPRHYGTGAAPIISDDEYDRLLQIQNGLCAICKRKERVANKALATDHNHVTGKIRGLLCMRCNAGIGLLGDTITAVQNALDYLRIADVV